jgi:hypothetical protein
VCPGTVNMSTGEVATSPLCLRVDISPLNKLFLLHPPSTDVPNARLENYSINSTRPTIASFLIAVLHLEEVRKCCRVF